MKTRSGSSTSATGFQSSAPGNLTTSTARWYFWLRSRAAMSRDKPCLWTAAFQRAPRVPWLVRRRPPGIRQPMLGRGRNDHWTGARPRHEIDSVSVFGVARNHVFGENHRVKIKDEE